MSELRVAELWRYPVKSTAGEPMTSMPLDERGPVGDRLWAVCDEDRKLGSGKNSRRFRRMDGLLDLSSRLVDGTPLITLPNGEVLEGEGESVDRALASALDRPGVGLRRESDIPTMTTRRSTSSRRPVSAGSRSCCRSRNWTPGGSAPTWWSTPPAFDRWSRTGSPPSLSSARFDCRWSAPQSAAAWSAPHSRSSTMTTACSRRSGWGATCSSASTRGYSCQVSWLSAQRWSSSSRRSPAAAPPGDRMSG